MTVSKSTAEDVAKKIYDEMATMSHDPLGSTLKIVEAIMTVPGNKSFQESMLLLHRAVKDYHVIRVHEREKRLQDAGQ